ncbi:hypothetical protein HELRODRAFT_155722 [Helobdella robusta]|uniref:Uncharacterized protein n=1 Tax=Helobdella robusta TaxID=6412 RepID=T1ELL5_HELRO|nr:hypothetical protein HELRODRAFT_155722 [Helobdella robusta]ESO06550.1 hypothetical protein HELRODRAFT_155722 [Helobdella robusta]
MIAGSKYYVDRQSYKIDSKGKTLSDNEVLKGIGLGEGGKIFFKDLGPQIGWSSVFLAEYAGPLFIYLFFYVRPSIIYSVDISGRSLASQVACACWCFHYLKRLYETIYVHRFSHSTMPLFNLFKNCSYYWGFTAFVSYYNNHPLYTPPITFIHKNIIWKVCEYGNYSIHIAFKDLRPPGSTVRQIPKPTTNPMTRLFELVSCPNYTYEVGSWFFFSVMIQSLPAFLFCLVGLGQMSIWALAKHKNYKKEFPDYPTKRKAILPFIL